MTRKKDLEIMIVCWRRGRGARRKGGTWAVMPACLGEVEGVGDALDIANSP